MIRIRAKTEGFRRCGVAHPATPTDHADDRFTPEEVKRLQAEPELVVEILPDAGEAGTEDVTEGIGKGIQINGGLDNLPPVAEPAPDTVTGVKKRPPKGEA